MAPRFCYMLTISLTFQYWCKLFICFGEYFNGNWVTSFFKEFFFLNDTSTAFEFGFSECTFQRTLSTLYNYIINYLTARVKSGLLMTTERLLAPLGNLILILIVRQLSVSSSEKWKVWVEGLKSLLLSFSITLAANEKKENIFERKLCINNILFLLATREDRDYNQFVYWFSKYIPGKLGESGNPPNPLQRVHKLRITFIIALRHCWCFLLSFSHECMMEFFSLHDV